MNNPANDIRIREVISAFDLPDGPYTCQPTGNGHINGTYLLTITEDQTSSSYILQCINKNVFTDPPALMENFTGITGWLQGKYRQAGENSSRYTLSLVKTKSGKDWYCDCLGDYWRITLYIEDSVSLDQVESPMDFYESALAFGRFQCMLSDYPAQKLHETIPDFHDTIKRFAAFEKAAAEDAAGRVKFLSEEIDFFRSREAFSHRLVDLMKEGTLPLRVTHNDTKLNNVLFDRVTRKAICIIDLDTVMPGLSVNDFGDSIRFGASTAAEDEKDLSKVSLNLEYYEQYVRGFLKGCSGSLLDAEIENLPIGAMMMTFECGIRFLTDYINGDHYFKIAYPEHNLDRAHTQMVLFADMERKYEQMCALTKKAAAEAASLS